jgi:phosphoglucosamine mutase
MGKLFGTDGLRGVAREFPLDNATIELLGSVLYFFLTDRKIDQQLIIGRDTRESGPYLYEALSRGFGQRGGRILDAGILSTPALAYLAKEERKCAISITASHNAYQDNGIKIFGPDGYKLSEETELEIEPFLLGERAFQRKIQFSASPDVKPMHEAFRDEYCLHLTKQLFRDLDLRGTRVALDCANGALYEIAPMVLRQLGAEVTSFHIEPNGLNINDHCGSLYPEVLLNEMQANGFDCGFTFDGDGDRCLVADQQTMYDGDFILASSARHLLSRGELKKNAVVATTMSNLGLEVFLKQHGIHLHRVPVGDKYVLEKLQKEQLSLGGEQSGHIIYMNDSFIGDGLLTALQLLRIYKNSGTTFSHLCDGFVKYPQILLNIPVRSKPDLLTIPEIQKKIETIDQELRDAGRMVVRYSGTEMKARVMIEGRDHDSIERMAKELGEIIRTKLG